MNPWIIIPGRGTDFGKGGDSMPENSTLGLIVGL